MGVGRGGWFKKSKTNKTKNKTNKKNQHPSLVILWFCLSCFFPSYDQSCVWVVCCLKTAATCKMYLPSIKIVCVIIFSWCLPSGRSIAHLCIKIRGSLLACCCVLWMETSVHGLVRLQFWSEELFGASYLLPEIGFHSSVLLGPVGPIHLWANTSA